MRVTAGIVAIATLWAGLAGPAICQPPPEPDIAAMLDVVTCPPGAGATDTKAHDQLVADLVSGPLTYARIAEQAPNLQAALDAAPACYPEIERIGESVVVRTDDMAQFLIVSATVANGAPSNGQATMQQNTYGFIALMLGSFAVEQRRYADALGALDRGLALQPHSQMLISEKVSALQGLRRFEDAHALLTQALADPAMTLTLDRARFLRLDGVVLIDLGRLDEAEASLKESIRLKRDNPIARDELQYIRQLRRGGGQRDVVITAPASPQPPKP